MLFNTAWNKTPEVQPQSDILSTARLIAWLKKQPADAAYNYDNPSKCLLAQYFNQSGHPEVVLGNHYIHYFNGGTTVALPQAFYAAATYLPHTFGAALRRAKAYL